nr:immunoglobulin heavy chain junction region [Macaca mulatta]
CARNWGHIYGGVFNNYFDVW